MPTPFYLSKGMDTTGSEKLIKWIGIKGKSLEGEEKNFLWAKNLRGINPRKPMLRGDLADVIVRIKLADGSEAVFGPAVDL